MSKRNIRSVYYNYKEEAVKTTASVHPRTATMRAVDHMQVDDYGAKVVEVYDHSVGTLHAVITRSPRKVEVVYKRDPKENQ
jgi:hypothetical protein